MPPDAVERREVWTVGSHDLDGRPGFKLAIHSAVPIPGTDLVAVNSEAIWGRDDPRNFTFLVVVSDDSMPGFDGKEPTGPRVLSWVPLPRPEPDLPYETYYEKGGRFGPHN